MAINVRTATRASVQHDATEEISHVQVLLIGLMNAVFRLATPHVRTLDESRWQTPMQMVFAESTVDRWRHLTAELRQLVDDGLAGAEPDPDPEILDDLANQVLLGVAMFLAAEEGDIDESMTSDPMSFDSAERDTVHTFWAALISVVEHGRWRSLESDLADVTPRSCAHAVDTPLAVSGSREESAAVWVSTKTDVVAPLQRRVIPVLQGLDHTVGRRLKNDAESAAWHHERLGRIQNWLQEREGQVRERQRVHATLPRGAYALMLVALAASETVAVACLLVLAGSLSELAMSLCAVLVAMASMYVIGLRIGSKRTIGRMLPGVAVLSSVAAGIGGVVSGGWFPWIGTVFAAAGGLGAGYLGLRPDALTVRFSRWRANIQHWRHSRASRRLRRQVVVALKAAARTRLSTEAGGPAGKWGVSHDESDANAAAELLKWAGFWSAHPGCLERELAAWLGAVDWQAEAARRGRHARRPAVQHAVPANTAEPLTGPTEGAPDVERAHTQSRRAGMSNRNKRREAVNAESPSHREETEAAPCR